jgi:hypothetical protein
MIAVANVLVRQPVYACQVRPLQTSSCVQRVACGSGVGAAVGACLVLTCSAPVPTIPICGGVGGVYCLVSGSRATPLEEARPVEALNVGDVAVQLPALPVMPISVCSTGVIYR